MDSSSTTAQLLMILVVGFSLGAPVVGTVATPTAAQQSTPTNGTSAPSEASDTATTVMYQFGDPGDGATLRDISWDGSTVSMTIHASEYTTLAVADAGKWVDISEGSGSGYRYRTYTIPSDTTRTVEFTVDSSTDVRAVSLTAHGDGYGYVEEKGNRLFAGGSAGWDEVHAAGAAVGIVTGGTAVLTAILTWYAMRRDYRRVI